MTKKTRTPCKVELPAGYHPAWEGIVKHWFAQLRPPPNLTLSQWADSERILSIESSSEPGRWHTERVPYMREVMDAISDVQQSKIVIVKAAQVAATESILNAIGYYITQDPTTMLAVLPTLEAAQSWSKDKLAPMLRDTPALKGKVVDIKADAQQQTQRQKSFPGGRLTIVGSNSPQGLRMRPVRVVLADEVDAFKPSVGKEGDALMLAEKRQTTYWNRKTVLASTPLHISTSIIWREFKLSDQRRYFVPCPHCQQLQYLQWAQVRWDQNEDGQHDAATAHYVCEHCGSLWDDWDRWRAIGHGSWQRTNVNATTTGYHIPGLLSPWLTLAKIVKEFLEARKDPDLLQVWTNTVLGEPWEEAAEAVEAASLISRGENYGVDTMPEGVRFLTAGVDIQVDRLELQVLGWGVRDECWVVDYEVVRGDPARPEVWAMLDHLLIKNYVNVKFQNFRIRAVCIDASDYHGNQVLQYCRQRRGRRVFAIKGSSGPKPIWPKLASKTKTNDPLYIVGVDTAKDAVKGRLLIAEAGPGYVHFPVGGMFGQEYYDQLTSERVVTRKRMGRPVRIWEKIPGRRNEVLDTFVYALAARYSTPIRLTADQVADTQPKVTDGDEPQAAEVEVEVAATPHVMRQRVRRIVPVRADRDQSWMGNRTRNWFHRD